MRWLWLASIGVAVLLGGRTGAASGDERPAELTRLLRDLQSAEFQTAFAAAEALGQRPAERARIAPALIHTLATGEWKRCGGDMRDAIARSLGELGVREAVVPLLELVKSGKPIDHECVE